MRGYYQGGPRPRGSAHRKPVPFHRIPGIDYDFRPADYSDWREPEDDPYLPPLGRNEIEIARLLLRTVQGDVISIRARFSRLAGPFRYRVVDEYESRYVVRPATSRRPLTLGELVGLIESTRHETGSPLGVALLEHQRRESGQPASGWADFLEAESRFYEQLGEHYRGAVAMWLRSVEGGQP